MKFIKNLLLTAFLTTQAFAVHTNSRSVYATDIVNQYGTSVFKFPTAAPTASRVCQINADGETTSSTITTTTLGFLDATSSIQTQLNGKQSTLTTGNISTSTTGVTVGSGTNSTVGPNVTVNVQTASGSQPGLLSSTDWTTFNNKYSGLPSQTGNSGKFLTTNGTVESWSTVSAGITALTGDVTASGSGSVAATVANVGGQTAANVAAGAVLANAATSANTASAIVKRDANSNAIINRMIPGTANFTTSQSLSVATAPIIYFTGSTAGQTLTLPDATTLTTSTYYTVINRSSNSVAVVDKGGNALATVAIFNSPVTFRCTNTGTSNGGWEVDWGLAPQTSTTTIGFRYKSDGTNFGQGYWSAGETNTLANNTTTVVLASADAKYDNIVSTYTGAASKTVTLPLASGTLWVNKVIWFYNFGGGTFIINNSGGGISGVSDWTLPNVGQGIALLARSNGDWYVVATTGNPPIQSVTASTLAPVLANSDFELNTASNNITVTLPDATGFYKNKRFYFIKTSASNTATFNTTASQTINGFASGTVILTKLNSYIEVESNGSNWDIRNDGRYFENTHSIGFGTAPTIAGGVGAGTSPTVSLIGVDEAEEISVTAGTTPTASSLIATVTFNKTYSVAPIVLCHASNANAASQLVFANSTTSAFTLTLASGTLVSATQYKWMCHVKGY